MLADCSERCQMKFKVKKKQNNRHWGEKSMTTRHEPWKRLVLEQRLSGDTAKLLDSVLPFQERVGGLGGCLVC